MSPPDESPPPSPKYFFMYRRRGKHRLLNGTETAYLTVYVAFLERREGLSGLRRHSYNPGSHWRHPGRRLKKKRMKEQGEGGWKKHIFATLIKTEATRRIYSMVGVARLPAVQDTGPEKINRTISIQPVSQAPLMKSGKRKDLAL
ncbi:hypothetical protein NPIL_297651 [Nephila pilipes]|uniref:Uncharacterized protein n=1 Tax=Nephila pilipes TaxID=299642 RepID=A0A8X6M9W8_NEPPI|nr:hypothetical protein NPIL_297651 [Nephila pilipes]